MSTIKRQFKAMLRACVAFLVLHGVASAQEKTSPAAAPFVGVWLGTENRKDAGAVTFDIKSGGVVHKSTKDGMQEGSWTLDGSLISMIFAKGDMVYEARIKAGKLVGTATQDDAVWTWEARKKDAIVEPEVGPTGRWSGTEDLDAYGVLTFEIQPRGVARMIDKDGTTQGTWKLEAGQLLLSFYEGKVIYRGKVSGETIVGTASNSKKEWAWRVRREANAQASPSAKLTGNEIYRQTLQGTVWVVTKTGSGSGWIWDRDKKLVVTNYHVVVETKIVNNNRRLVVMDEVLILFPDYKGDKVIFEKQHYLDNLKRLGHKAQVVYADPRTDLAVVKLESLPAKARALPLATTPVEPADRVHTVGNPGVSSALWAYTFGTVRTVHKKKFRTQTGEHEFTGIETQSPVNPGDSGGPLVNAKGEVVGVVQSLMRNANLVQFCVDVSEIRQQLTNYLGTERPKNASDFYNRGLIHDLKGNDQKALEEYDKSLAVDPKFAISYRNRGDIYHRQNDLDAAIAEYTKAIEFDSTNSSFYLNLANTHFNKRDYDKAIEKYTRALELGCRQPGAYHFRGIAYFVTNQNDKALVDLNAGLAIEPHAWAYCHRGEIRRVNGDNAGARDDWQNALRHAVPGDNALIERVKTNLANLP